MNKEVPEGTLRIEIHGVPSTKQEYEDLREAVALMFWPFPEDSSEAENFRLNWEGQHFVQPYAQGGGFVEITKTGESQAKKTVKDDSDEQERSKPWGWRTEETGSARFTGWVITDWYTDSMTGVYESPVFHDTEREYYFTWEQ